MKSFSSALACPCSADCILHDIENDYKYKLQYEEDIKKGIRFDRNKWKLATVNVNIEQNESILNELGVDLEEIKERVKKQYGNRILVSRIVISYTQMNR